MRPRMRRSPETIFKHVFLVVAFLGIISILKSAHEASSVSPQWLVKRRLEQPKNEECRLVHNQPDQCAFVQASCPDEEAGLFSYLKLYYCSLSNVKPFAFIILAVWISILFSTIGIAASDFLCLNLSTISAVMGMSESLAGVTFLAFGNGSPDVFSTFAAFSSHSGSLAVGELMGAAGFITAVVAGSMAITKPFRVAKKAFVRDVLLFAIAAGFSLNFLKDGSLRMWECTVMIGFYVAYVMFVVAWHWYFERRRRIKLAETAARLHQHIPDQQELDIPEVEDDEESRPAAERTPLIRTASGGSIPSQYTPGTPAWANAPGTPAWAATHVDDVDDETRDHYLAALSSNMRVKRPGRDRRNTLNPIRPSLIGALEFRSVLNALEKKSTNAQPIYMRRYSDEGRHILAQAAESQGFVSHPELLSDAAQQSDMRGSSPSGVNGRGRAVSANDAWSLGINRDLSGAHDGTPQTAIYSPSQPAQPSSVFSELARGETDYLSARSPNLLLSPSSMSSAASMSGSLSPSSMTATRNGFLAPPGSDFRRPDYSDPAARSETAAVSPGAISPLALVPKLQIPNTGQRSPPEFRFTESPSGISTPFSGPPSIRLPPPSMSPESSHILHLPEDDSPPRRQLKWWPYKYMPAPEVLLSTLFPSFCGWSERSWPDRILAICTAPSIFLLTITVPVVESKADDDDLEPEPILVTPGGRSPSISRPTTAIMVPSHSPQQARSRAHSSATVPQITTNDGAELLPTGPKEWNRWLAIVQVFTAPMFMVLIVWANIEGETNIKLLIRLVAGSLILSLLGLVLLLAVTTPTREPKHKPVLCFLGFFVAIAWISTIAGEVVGVLKAFGVILNISDAILGLTIFAVGNSLGDLVADITVAKLGYPMMALSACFGGPMLNILLGIGIGGLYQTLSNANQKLKKHPNKPIHYKPYELEVSTTLLISGATLLVTLVFLLIVVPLNKWRMDRKIGIGLIILWATSTVLNVVLEIVGIGQTELLSIG